MPGLCQKLGRRLWIKSPFLPSGSWTQWGRWSNWWTMTIPCPSWWSSCTVSGPSLRQRGRWIYFKINRNCIQQCWSLCRVWCCRSAQRRRLFYNGAFCPLRDGHQLNQRGLATIRFKATQEVGEWKTRVLPHLLGRDLQVLGQWWTTANACSRGVSLPEDWGDQPVTWTSLRPWKMCSLGWPGGKRRLIFPLENM